jgi:hypothetical protein
MRFVTNWKVAVLLAFAFAGTVQAGGCTDREIITGVVSATAAAIIVDSNNRSYEPAPRSHSCERVREKRCWNVTDYYGRVIGQECERTEYRQCGRRYNMSLTSNSASDLNVDDVAATYKLSIASAEKLVGALATAQTAQDDETAKAALESICLNVQEFKGLNKSGSVSNATIDCLAKALNQDVKQTAMMVGSITETARAQNEARNQNHNN